MTAIKGLMVRLPPPSRTVFLEETKKRERMVLLAKIEAELDAANIKIKAALDDIPGLTGHCIARAVAAAYGLTLTTLRTKRRWAYVVRARQHAMHEVKKRKWPAVSYNMIANIVGVGHHTTVMHGIESHEMRLKGRNA
jgi:chromosomal replication initiation ATPase DnaA